MNENNSMQDEQLLVKFVERFVVHFSLPPYVDNIVNIRGVIGKL